MSQVFMRKEVASLPDKLEPNCLYYVRTGNGFDIYLSDQTGSIAHKQNTDNSEVLRELATLDNSLNKLKDSIENSSSSNNTNTDTELRDLLLNRRKASVQFLIELSGKIINNSSYVPSDQEIVFLQRIWSNKSIMDYVDEECYKVKGTEEDYLEPLLRNPTIRQLFTSKFNFLPKYGLTNSWDFEDIEYGNLTEIKRRLLDLPYLDITNVRLSVSKLTSNQYIDLVYTLLAKYPQSIDLLLSAVRLQSSAFISVLSSNPNFELIIDNFINHCLTNINDSVKFLESLPVESRKLIFNKYRDNSKFKTFILTTFLKFSGEHNNSSVSSIGAWYYDNYFGDGNLNNNQASFINYSIRELWNLSLNDFKKEIKLILDRNKSEISNDNFLHRLLVEVLPSYNGSWELYDLYNTEDRHQDTAIIRTFEELTDNKRLSKVNASEIDFRRKILISNSINHLKEDRFSFIYPNNRDLMDKIYYLDSILSDGGYKYKSLASAFWRNYFTDYDKTSKACYLLEWTDKTWYFNLLDYLADIKNSELQEGIFRELRSNQMSKGFDDRQSGLQYWVLPWVATGKCHDLPTDIYSIIMNDSYGQPISKAILELAETDQSAFNNAWVRNKINKSISTKTKISDEDKESIIKNPIFNSVYQNLTLEEKLIVGIDRVTIDAESKLSKKLSRFTLNGQYSPGLWTLSDLKELKFKTGLSYQSLSEADDLIKLGLMSISNFDIDEKILLNRPFCRENPDLFYLFSDNVRHFYNKVKANTTDWELVDQGEFDNVQSIYNWSDVNFIDETDRIIIFYSLGTWSNTDPESAISFVLPILLDVDENVEKWDQFRQLRPMEKYPFVVSLQWTKENAKSRYIVYGNSGTRMNTEEYRINGLSGVWNRDITGGEYGDTSIGYTVFRYIGPELDFIPQFR